MLTSLASVVSGDPENSSWDCRLSHLPFFVVQWVGRFRLQNQVGFWVWLYLLRAVWTWVSQFSGFNFYKMGHITPLLSILLLGGSKEIIIQLNYKVLTNVTVLIFLSSSKCVVVINLEYRQCIIIFARRIVVPDGNWPPRLDMLNSQHGLHPFVLQPLPSLETKFLWLACPSCYPFFPFLFCCQHEWISSVVDWQPLLFKLSSSAASDPIEPPPRTHSHLLHGESHCPSQAPATHSDWQPPPTPKFMFLPS